MSKDTTVTRRWDIQARADGKSAWIIPMECEEGTYVLHYDYLQHTRELREKIADLEKKLAFVGIYR